MKKCDHCGQFNDDIASFCSSCGSKLISDDEIDAALNVVTAKGANTNFRKIHCPRCAGTNLQAINEGNVSGAMVNNKMYVGTENKSYWICSNCGAKFRNLDDWHKELESTRKIKNFNLLCTIMSILFSLVFFAVGDEGLMIAGIFFLVAAFISGSVTLMLKIAYGSRLKKYEELKKQSYY